MKCKNCEFEFQDDMNFCPNCGTKAGEEKRQEQQFIEVVKVKKDPKEIWASVCLLALYFGIGLSVVSLFIGFDGFGLLKGRQINYVSVWVTLVVAIAIAISGALAYFLKFNNKK